MEEGEVVVGFAVAAGRDPAFLLSARRWCVRRASGGGLAGRGSFSVVSFAALESRTGGSWDHPFGLALALIGASSRGSTLIERPRGGMRMARQFRVAGMPAQKACRSRQQVPPLVLVAAAQPDRERRPVRVYGEVETAAGPALERARDLLAPFRSISEALKRPLRRPVQSDLADRPPQKAADRLL